jgi:flagellar motor switch/type III secretory pathway protein FliN
MITNINPDIIIQLQVLGSKPGLFSEKQTFLASLPDELGSKVIGLLDGISGHLGGEAAAYDHLRMVCEAEALCPGYVTSTDPVGQLVYSNDDPNSYCQKAWYEWEAGTKLLWWPGPSGWMCSVNGENYVESECPSRDDDLVFVDEDRRVAYRDWLALQNDVDDEIDDLITGLDETFNSAVEVPLSTKQEERPAWRRTEIQGKRTPVSRKPHHTKQKEQKTRSETPEDIDVVVSFQVGGTRVRGTVGYSKFSKRFDTTDLPRNPGERIAIFGGGSLVLSRLYGKRGLAAGPEATAVKAVETETQQALRYITGRTSRVVQVVEYVTIGDIVILARSSGRAAENTVEENTVKCLIALAELLEMKPTKGSVESTGSEYVIEPENEQVKNLLRSSGKTKARRKSGVQTRAGQIGKDRESTRASARGSSGSDHGRAPQTGSPSPSPDPTEALVKFDVAEVDPVTGANSVRSASSAEFKIIVEFNDDYTPLGRPQRLEEFIKILQDISMKSAIEPLGSAVSALRSKDVGTELPIDAFGPGAALRLKDVGTIVLRAPVKPTDRATWNSLDHGKSYEFIVAGPKEVIIGSGAGSETFPYKFVKAKLGFGSVRKPRFGNKVEVRWGGAGSQPTGLEQTWNGFLRELKSGRKATVK